MLITELVVPPLKKCFLRLAANKKSGTSYYFRIYNKSKKCRKGNNRIKNAALCSEQIITCTKQPPICQLCHVQAYFKNRCNFSCLIGVPILHHFFKITRINTTAYVYSSGEYEKANYIIKIQNVICFFC